MKNIILCSTLAVSSFLTNYAVAIDIATSYEVNLLTLRDISGTIPKFEGMRCTLQPSGELNKSLLKCPNNELGKIVELPSSGISLVVVNNSRLDIGEFVYAVEAEGQKYCFKYPAGSSIAANGPGVYLYKNPEIKYIKMTADAGNCSSANAIWKNVTYNNVSRLSSRYTIIEVAPQTDNPEADQYIIK
ncbi:MAG: hypothetical protein K0R14_1521 [Burkholderiales bacterium]|jgi:hypothetical protein|nr:hypothetical protein [Burkholderiales bacterium]